MTTREPCESRVTDAFLDSILFRDSTHSFHFAHPLGTTETSIPLFASRSSDTDVPTSAVLGPPFSLYPRVYSFSLPFRFGRVFFPRFSFSTSLRSQTGVSSSSDPPPLSLFRFLQPFPSPRQPPLRPPFVRTSNIVDMSRLRLENRECSPSDAHSCAYRCARTDRCASKAMQGFPGNCGIFVRERNDGIDGVCRRIDARLAGWTGLVFSILSGLF